MILDSRVEARWGPHGKSDINRKNWLERPAAGTHRGPPCRKQGGWEGQDFWAFSFRLCSHSPSGPALPCPWHRRWSASLPRGISCVMSTRIVARFAFAGFIVVGGWNVEQRYAPLGHIRFIGGVCRVVLALTGLIPRKNLHASDRRRGRANWSSAHTGFRPSRGTTPGPAATARSRTRPRRTRWTRAASPGPTSWCRAPAGGGARLQSLWRGRSSTFALRRRVYCRWGASRKISRWNYLGCCGGGGSGDNLALLTGRPWELQVMASFKTSLALWPPSKDGAWGRFKLWSPNQGCA